MGEAGLHVIGFGGPIIVVLVTGDTIGGESGKDTGVMTLVTVYRGMAADQGELTVINGSAFPGIDGMALITIRGKARGNMIGLGSGIILLLMTVDTLAG